MPKTIAFELSSQCEHECPYCDRKNWTSDFQRKTPHMDYALFSQLVDEVSGMIPVPSITASYEGESVLHPEFVKMLGYFNRKNIRPWITIRPELNCEPELNAIIENCSAVSVSIELSDINLGSKYIEHLLELKTLKNSNLEISVNHTLSSPNKLTSPLGILFIETFINKVHEIYFWNKIKYGTSITHNNKSGIEEHLKRRRVCLQPTSFLAILSDGRVSPCCNTSRVVLKTIDASKGINAVLASPEYIRFLEDHEDILLKKYICEKCTLWMNEWLGDETIQISLFNGNKTDAYLEGHTIRIAGSLPQVVEGAK